MSSIARITELSRSKYSPNTFQPTDTQQRAKSAFWSHFFSTGEVVPSQVEPAMAARLSGYNQVLEWWVQVEGFSVWFSNGEEFRQKVEYLSVQALDVIQAVLVDETARVGDKLQAAKMALEIASKFPKNSPKETSAGDQIDKMSRDELEAYIQSRVPTLFPSDVKSVDTTD